MVFAAAAGVVYGFVDRSVRKGRYGVIGAIIGGELDGLAFNPISAAAGSGAPSRAIGFALIGLATGVAIGIVESALKDRWLYVASGRSQASNLFFISRSPPLAAASRATSIFSKTPAFFPSTERLRCAVRRHFCVLTGRFLFPEHLPVIARCRAATLCRLAATRFTFAKGRETNGRCLSLLPHAF